MNFPPETTPIQKLVAGMIVIVSGVVYPPIWAAVAVVLFLSICLFIVFRLPPIIKNSINDASETRIAVAQEAQRRQTIRQNTEPKTIFVTLASRQDQGMSTAALILIEEKSKATITLQQDDYLTIYDQDNTVLFAGRIDLGPPIPAYKRWLFGSSTANTAEYKRNWKKWFSETPALRAELTRYNY